MNQKVMQSFESECGKAKIFVENDMPIGVFHDFLMLIKGLMIDRMVAAHKEQMEQAKKSMAQEDIESCAPCEGE